MCIVSAESFGDPLELNTGRYAFQPIIYIPIHFEWNARQTDMGNRLYLPGFSLPASSMSSSLSAIGEDENDGDGS